MIKYLIAFLLFTYPCLAGMGIGGFPYPGPGVLPITYTLTIDGTGWDGTDYVSVGGSTYTADGTKTGLSGNVSITVTPGAGRTESCSGTGITGTSSPYTGGMTANRTIACTFSAAMPALYDTFTETSNTAITSHTPNSGGTWYSSGGSDIYIDAATDKLKATTSTTMFAINSEPSIGSVTLEVKPASIGYDINGGCLSDSSNMSGDAYCAFIKPGTNEFLVVKWVNGIWSSTSQVNADVVYANKYEDVYTVSIETTGSHILASVKNGAATLSSIDVAVSFAGGYGGVIISGTSVSIDNITGY